MHNTLDKIIYNTNTSNQSSTVIHNALRTEESVFFPMTAKSNIKKNNL